MNEPTKKLARRCRTSNGGSMTEREINKKYLGWMKRIIKSKKIDVKSYSKLLERMHWTSFYCILPMDENREIDGIDLRYRFGYENGYDQREISYLLDVRPCSVLEMMIALALRCEDTIMSNPDIGDRTGKWFWDMVENLGLIGMTDDNFDAEFVDSILHKFLERDYSPNGKGGLFTSKRGKDMRNVEIWYQLSWYLTDNYGREAEL